MRTRAPQARPGTGLACRKHLARRIAQAQHEVGGHGRFAHRAAHAVGAEIASRHALRQASQTRTTSRVSFTSCTRNILAPPSSASKAAARLADSRAPVSRSEEHTSE